MFISYTNQPSNQQIEQHWSLGWLKEVVTVFVDPWQCHKLPSPGINHNDTSRVLPADLDWLARWSWVDWWWRIIYKWLLFCWWLIHSCWLISILCWYLFRRVFLKVKGLLMILGQSRLLSFPSNHYEHTGAQTTKHTVFNPDIIYSNRFLKRHETSWNYIIKNSWIISTTTIPTKMILWGGGYLHWSTHTPSTVVMLSAPGSPCMAMAAARSIEPQPGISAWLQRLKGWVLSGCWVGSYIFLLAFQCWSLYQWCIPIVGFPMATIGWFPC